LSEWIFLEDRKKITACKIPGKKTCGQTTTTMGRQHLEGLLIAAEYERVEETSRGQGQLESNC
jgi:hypothetical protein